MHDFKNNTNLKTFRAKYNHFNQDFRIQITVTVLCSIYRHMIYFLKIILNNLFL